ncbi:MAG: GNAT family N-acetyltransferase [Pseudomonadota bacterium]
MTARIRIRAPERSDEKAFLAAVARSRAYHRPWVKAPSTPAQYREWLERLKQPTHFSFLVLRRDTDEIVGVFNISNIVMGGFLSAFLGYYGFAGHERQGLMAEGLRAVVNHAFKKLKLHRLEANIQPGNAPSIALAAACGFEMEGYSPRYLKIGGRWRDHERWAIRAS